MKHDLCRNTVQFPYSGQNLFIFSNFPTHLSLEKTMTDGINAWYNEYINATQADIDVCCGGTKFGAIGHFTAMMQDQNIAVGCGAARYTDVNGQKITYVACNYAWTNLFNTKVYVSGSPASQCSQTDTTYTSLCVYTPPTTTTSTTSIVTTTTTVSQQQSTTQSTTNYCSLCANHIACNNTGNFAAACPTDATLVPLSTDIKNSILNSHNSYRNKIASGGQVGFSTAAKMNKLVRNFCNLLNLITRHF